MVSRVLVSYYTARMPEPRRRFPAPWTVVEDQHGFKIHDASGMQLAAVYHRDDLVKRDLDAQNYLSRDEARRIAAGIARLPELLKGERT